MRVAVIGAGVVGVSTAYFLARNGHQVSVIEQHGNVCEEASLGHAGLLGAAHLMPLAAPGMPAQILSHWFKSDSPVKLQPGFNVQRWRWLRSWMHECSVERMLVNKEKMQRLGKLGQQLLNDITQLHSLDFQQRDGLLQLFRNDKELNRVTPALAMLTQADIPFRQLDQAECHLLEPALNKHTPFIGGLYFPQDSQGNCALFTKQVKAIAQQADVDFAFFTRCERIDSTPHGVTLQLKQDELVKHQQFDAVVLSAGENSIPFFKSVGIHCRVVPVRTYSNTANIKNMEDSPRLSIIDDHAQVAITRMDKRIRVAGTLLAGRARHAEDERAWTFLRKIGTDWFPDAANYHTGSNWRGTHLMLPDNTPLIGQVGNKPVFVNCAQAEYGWSMSLGSAKIVADLISGKAPDISLDGLTLVA